MATNTLGFSTKDRGWSSFYSFNPEGMLTLNNNQYSWNNGRLHIHNQETSNRNNFYGIDYDSTVTLVFNQDVSVVKNFKTLNYEGDGSWTAELTTDQETGIINSTQFLIKEGKHFAWVRGTDNKITLDQPMVSVNDLRSSNVSGVGVNNGISGTLASGSELTISFGFDVPNSVSIGDSIYRIVPGTSNNFSATPQPVGIVASKTTNSINVTLTGVPSIDRNGNEFNTHTPSVGDFILNVKSNQLEKSGIIGLYSVVKMTNNSSQPVALFSVSSEVFRSSN